MRNAYQGTTESYQTQSYCSVLFANIWQLLVSSIYFQYNALLTSLLVNNEWQSYRCCRKALRCSWPISLQREAYFLSLPWKYGLPLQAAIAFLHFTLSQSVFVVPLEFYTLGGIYGGRQAATGYSIWPMITSIIFGLIVTALPLGLGFQKYDERMPLGATCSLVISAACHRPNEDDEAHLLPVQWASIYPSNTGRHDLNSFEVRQVSEEPDEEWLELSQINTEESSVDPEDGNMAAIEGNYSHDADSNTASPNVGTTRPDHCCFTTYRHAQELL